MKTCKKCNSSMFDIDINEQGLCPKCFKEEKIKKQDEEKLNLQKKEAIDSCKNCGEKMKKLYLNSDGLCYKCSNNKVIKENIKSIENNIKQQINQENKKVNIPNIDVYTEEQNQNVNTYQKSYWHWFGYLWNIFINIFIIFVILNIYSNITTPFEKIVVSLLILIYISLQTFSMVQGKINAEKIFFLYDQFKNIRNLLKEEIEEDEEQEIKQAKDKIKKVTVKIYINAFFLTIIYFIAIINIIFPN